MTHCTNPTRITLYLGHDVLPLLGVFLSCGGELGLNRKDEVEKPCVHLGGLLPGLLPDAVGRGQLPWEAGPGGAAAAGGPGHPDLRSGVDTRLEGCSTWKVTQEDTRSITRVSRKRICSQLVVNQTYQIWQKK